MRVDAGDLGSSLERGVQEQVFQFQDIFDGEAGQVQLREGPARLLQMHDFGEIADHARGANQLLEANFLEARQRRLELGLHLLFKALQRVGGRIFLQIQVVESDRAELQAGGMEQRVPVAHDEFDGTAADIHDQRSEEHTSELQSRLHLVCRLLLEKKKKTTSTTSID